MMQKQIALMGPFGGGNLGDAATQQAMIQAIRQRYPNAELVAFSHSPQDTAWRHGLPGFFLSASPEESQQVRQKFHCLLDRLRVGEAASLRQLERWLVRLPLEATLWQRAWRNLGAVDCLVVSGGGQLDDYWGGAFSHPYTLLRYAILARLRGAKLYFVSVGAGPLASALSRQFVRWALRLAHYRSYRDEDSKQFLQRIGFANNDPVYPDLAHAITFEDLGDRPEAIGVCPPLPATLPHIQTHPVKIVGLNPMAYFDPRVWPERDQQVFEGYLHKLADFTLWLLERGNRVLLYPGEALHDRWAIDDLRAILRSRGIGAEDDRLCAPPIETVDQLLATLRTVDLVVASRFHGVLLPQRLHKPVLALSYHRKIDALMQEVNCADYCLPIGSFTVDSLIECFVMLETNANTIQCLLAKKTLVYQAALAEQFQKIWRLNESGIHAK